MDINISGVLSTKIERVEQSVEPNTITNGGKWIKIAITADTELGVPVVVNFYSKHHDNWTDAVKENMWPGQFNNRG